MAEILTFLLWLAPTIRYRFEFGVISFSFMEPLSILVIFLFLILSLKLKIPRKIPMDNVTQMLFLFIIWVLMVRVFGKDWQHGLSDVRDWLIPLLIYISLLSIFRRGWEKRTHLFIFVGFIQSIIGIYQHIFNNFRPFATEASLYKTGFIPASINSSPSFGLFEHPNSLAAYLLISLLIGYAWYRITKPNQVLIPILCLIAIAFYWSFAKAQILSLFFIITLVLLIRFGKSAVGFGITSITLLIIGLSAGWLFMNIYPELFGTFWWRVGLWKSVFQTISEQPTILLIGNGDILFAQNAIWPQPHNLYLHLLLLYGIPGLVIILVMFFFFFRYGLLAIKRGFFHKNPVLATLWLATLSYLVIGIVESSFISIETRTIFLILVASFMGIRREIAERNPLAINETNSHLSGTENSVLMS